METPACVRHSGRPEGIEACPGSRRPGPTTGPGSGSGATVRRSGGAWPPPRSGATGEAPACRRPFCLSTRADRLTTGSPSARSAAQTPSGDSIKCLDPGSRDLRTWVSVHRDQGQRVNSRILPDRLSDPGLDRVRASRSTVFRLYVRPVRAVPEPGLYEPVTRVMVTRQ